MARRKRAAIGSSKVRRDDWTTYSVGVLTGALALFALWYEANHGVPMNWLYIGGGACGAAILGWLLLKWPKAAWGTRPRRSVETVGFMLMGPFIIALALCLFYTILPSDFAPKPDLV